MKIGITKEKYEKCLFELKVCDTFREAAQNAQVSETTLRLVRRSSCYLNYLALAANSRNLKAYLSVPENALQFDKPTKSVPSKVLTEESKGILSKIFKWG